jgi:hypothetical protein
MTKQRPKQTRPRQRWHDAIIVDYVTLSALPNVERVALGWKERKGTITARRAVKLYVREKKKVPSAKALPTYASVLVPIGRGLYQRRRIITDVVWHAETRLTALPTDFCNPVASGCQVAGAGSGEAGTYACIVTDATNRPQGITAGHVVQAFQGTIGPNAPILQPSVPPPGLPPDVSLLLGRTVRGFFGNTPAGFLDFATIALDPQRAGASIALDGARITGQVMSVSTLMSTPSVRVTKFGGVTGRTFAIFSGLPPTVPAGGMVLTKVLEFLGLPGRLFADRGDSGALVVCADPPFAGSIVGLLIASMQPTPDAPAGRGFVVPFERIPGVRPLP